MHGRARPERVTALGSTGIASSRLGVLTEDTITLAVQWRNRAAHGDGGGDATFAGGSLGHATYTSSWAAPKSDVHSQQRWFYLGQKGELNVDQAHRGYTVATDGGGFASVRPPRGPNPPQPNRARPAASPSQVNPLFWKPTRDAVSGDFTGQRTYGCIESHA